MIFQGRGSTGECACEGVTVSFFLSWIAEEAKLVKPGQMPLAGVNWDGFRSSEEPCG